MVFELTSDVCMGYNKMDYPCPRVPSGIHGKGKEIQAPRGPLLYWTNTEYNISRNMSIRYCAIC
ncbi:MAG: hypothetical protein [Inoviridae sp.]|nr:MAG: hypothetical protein [Inoviridae sp.]